MMVKTDGTNVVAIAEGSQIEITSSVHQNATIIGFLADEVDGVQFENAAAWAVQQNDVPMRPDAS
jgi:hypothetical protein